MKLSVIITTHNRLSQLQAAYDSVCSQTVKPDEIIIVDDASTIAVTHYLLNTHRQNIATTIKRFNQPQGACKARNYGIRHSHGEIVMFLDDDDTWESEKIAKQLGIFARNSAIGLVYSGRLVVSKNNRHRVLYAIEPKEVGKLYPDILARNFIGSTSSVAVKKSLLLEVGGFDESLPALQDYELWIRLTQKTLVSHDNSCLVRYTIAENSREQISGKPEKYIQAGKIIRQKHQYAIADRSLVEQRKINSGLDFFVARYARPSNLPLAIFWSLKSFFAYPNFKSLVLLLPLKMLYFCKRLLKKKSKPSINSYRIPQSTK